MMPRFAARIDQGAGRGLRDDAGGGRNRHHDADAGFIPLPNGEQIDGEVGSEPVAHIGKEEVGSIKGAVGSARPSSLRRLRHFESPAARASPSNEHEWKWFRSTLRLPASSRLQRR
jgi:hypothetical protein